MNRISTDTLIIGAGPAGLACAAELFKAGKEFIIVEKSDRVGGLAKTYAFTEPDGLTFYTDNGPHRFFSKNQSLYAFIENLIGNEWIKVKRQTRQYIGGAFYDYPVNVVQAVKTMGVLRALRMGIDYLWAKIVYGLFRKNIRTFDDYAVANFGRSLADFNIVNYTEKIWGIPAREIHPQWAIQRIKGVSVWSVLVAAAKKIFSRSSISGPKSMVDEFYYPARGTGQIYDAIAQRIRTGGRTILTGTMPTHIHHAASRVTSVEVSGPDGDIEISCNQLVESIPITEMVPLLTPQVPAEVSRALSLLRHRHQVYLFITLDKPSVTLDQWIYFPLKDTPIARVSEMKNFSASMSPEGKTSLFIEFFCFGDDPIWSMTAEELYEVAAKELVNAGFFSQKEVRHFYHIRQRNVYPVYDLEYEERLAVAKKYLNSFSNLFYIGRPGRFRYNNQDHSLEMGMMAARSIVDGVRYDIEAVGEEKEYYEKGSVPPAARQ